MALDSRPRGNDDGSAPVGVPKLPVELAREIVELVTERAAFVGRKLSVVHEAPLFARNVVSVRVADKMSAVRRLHA